jgi:Hsp70 protein
VPGHAIDVHLTRDEVEAVATPLFSPIGDLATRVVAEAGLAPGDLAAVLLVGGGSRIPLLARLVHTRLGIAPTVVERPETVVAEGALYAARGDEPDPAYPADAPHLTPATPVAQATPARTAPVPGGIRRRWLRPTTLVLALLCFLMPFATVSCGLPGGYGRATPSGATTYIGLDLVLGGTPDVKAQHVRPPAESRADRLPPQPAMLLALLAALAAAVAAFAVRAPRRRRAVVAALAAAGALLLIIGQAIVVDLLADRVREQSPLPAGRTAHDFVGTAFGFWFAFLLLVGTAVANTVGLRRRALVAAGRRSR